MNNKVNVTFTGEPTYDQATNLAFAGSGLDELFLFSNDIQVAPTNAVVDAFYVPENLSNFGVFATVTETATRQDIKRRLAPRLSRATYGQGLVIWSNADNFTQYFLESVLIETGGYGFLRVGICNYTADYANNALAPDQQPVLNAIYSFFDISAA